MDRLNTRVRREPLGGCDRKPVWLGGAGATVDALDGALLIRLRERHATARLPIDRVERVVCRRNTDWSGRALELCLSSGVPVVILNGAGEALGWTESAAAVDCEADAGMQRFVSDSGWRRRYLDWLRARRMDVFRRAAAPANCDWSITERGELGRQKRRFVYRAEMPGQAPEMARAWIAGLVVSRLRSNGLRGFYAGYGEANLQLAVDLARLLQAELVFALGNLAAAEAGEPARLRLLEACAQSLGASAQAHLWSLLHLIRVDLPTWP